jgi:hypothetical protein
MAAAAAVVGPMSALRFICAAWILPTGFSLFAFFGFFTNYTTDVFSRAGIAAQYERSVFRYRVLGRWLVDAVSVRFEHMAIAWETPRALAVLDPAGNAATYAAYAFVHILCTCVGCSVLLAAVRTRDRAVAAELFVVGVSMLLALTAFVVTPYDGVFFMWQMVALSLTIAVEPSRALLPLAIVSLMAALTRETAYFIPVFVLAVHYRRILNGDRAARVLLVTTAAVVVLAYAGLRLAMGWGGGSVFYSWQAATNLKWTSLTGTVMLAATMILLCGTGPNRTARLCYAGLALPYILFVHVFAEPWEWRLWIPIIVPTATLLMLPDRHPSTTA